MLHISIDLLYILIMLILVAKSIVQTCQMSPSQWEARTPDDRPIYIRFRHGGLSVNVGPVGGTISDALDTERIYDEQVSDDHDPGIELDEVCRLTGITIL